MSTIIEPGQTKPAQGRHRKPGGTAPDNPPEHKVAPETKKKHGKRWILAAVAVGSALTIYVIYVLLTDIGGPDLPLVYYTVGRGDLDITVTERGNLESQDNVEIICMVDDIRGDNIDGTPIRWIVENGSSVEKDDLLVELDSASHLERLDAKILEVEKARAERIKTRALYEDQISQNEKATQDAELQVRLAELELKMFTDETSGTHQLEVEEIERTLDDVNNEILAAQASLELSRNDRDGIESLFKLGYAGKSEVERARLDFLQAESAYAAKLNRLKTQLATLEKKKTYEREMQLLQLQGNVETAKRDRVQVAINNKAELEQAQAAMEAAERALEKEEELLARYKTQMDNCKIFAPQDGMVAYAVSGRSWRDQPIAQGSPVNERQLIMTLPNLKKMQVKTAVHESVLDQIRAGLPATVRIDAFPDRRYAGSVKSVAVLPDQGGWMSSDTKVYETVVTVDEEVAQLKPGMTAVVDIHVDHLDDVISIPTQAIVQVGRESWCYVDKDGNLEKRPIDLGMSNNKFVEIRDGLTVGDRLVLNPMSIVQHESKDGKKPLHSTADPGESDGRRRRGSGSEEPKEKPGVEKVAKPQPPRERPTGEATPDEAAPAQTSVPVPAS